MIEVRREPADGPAARALFERYVALLRERLGAEFMPGEEIVGTEEAFSAWLVLYEDGRAVACAGLRPLETGVAEIKRMYVAPESRRRGHARRLLAELEGIALADGARRVRLLTTEVLVEAGALYASAGYRVVESYVREGRRDAWLEKTLTA